MEYSIPISPYPSLHTCLSIPIFSLTFTIPTFTIPTVFEELVLQLQYDAEASRLAILANPAGTLDEVRFKALTTLPSLLLLPSSLLPAPSLLLLSSSSY